MNIPQSLKYTKEHEWVREDSDTVTVGITDHAQGELGDIIFVEFDIDNRSNDLCNYSIAHIFLLKLLLHRQLSQRALE